MSARAIALRAIVSLATVLAGWHPGCALADAALPALDRYLVERSGVRLEITAPRPDIVRVRVGHPDLPENASWAVGATARTERVPLQIRRKGRLVHLDTGVVDVRIDESSLNIAILDERGAPLLQDGAKGITFSNGGFLLSKLAAPGMHYFGLGDKTGPLDHRGGVFTLWNSDAFGFTPQSDPLYKSIPFFLGADADGRGVGFFLDNTWRSNFDFARRDPHTLGISADGGPVDYYVLAGPDPKAVLRQYAWLTGTAPLMPMWALGFQQSHWGYKTQDVVSDIARHLRRDHIPADVMYLDIDYQDHNRPFTIDAASFPDLKKLVSELQAQGLHLILITDLHVARAPGQGYAPYDSGKAADFFVKTPLGADYVGKVWPGDAVFPDFSRAEVRKWWGEQYSAFVAMGVSGFWNDMNEPAIFEVEGKTMPLETIHTIHEPGFVSRPALHAELHNVYGMLNSRASYEGVLELRPDRRPFVLTRASYAGGQRYAATWTGDNSSSWEHLSLSIRMLANLGLSGFAYSGDDIGGFTGEQPSAELLTRWVEIGAFNPLFRIHYGDTKPPQEVWVGGSRHEAIRRHFIEERYRLLPYLYALAEENSRTGLPILRPLFLEFPATLAAGWEVGNQAQEFLLGDRLLIAPPASWEPAQDYTIKLPGSGWFDYWTGLPLLSGQVIEKPRIDHLPVFVRAGSILARQPLVQSTSQRPDGPLELHVYPGADCAGQIYLDDGESFAYTRGEYLRQRFTCASGADSLQIGLGRRAGTFAPWWKQISIIVHGWTRTTSKVLLDETPISAQLDASGATLRIELPDQADAATIRILPGISPIQ